MSNLTHMFKINQEIKVLIDVPSISDHMWYEQDFNLDEVYPLYNF